MMNVADNITGFFKWLISSVLYDPQNPLFFTGAFFIVFFLLFFIVYAGSVSTPRCRAMVILFFSLWFYYKCSGIFVVVIVAAAALNYYVALAIGATDDKRRRAMILFAGIVVNLAMLVLFKYTPYFRKMAEIFATTRWSVETLVFPAGISFFTFANLSYIIDVKKGVTPPESSFSRYLTYITFFPMVQMGPIERARNFIPQLSQPLHLSQEDVAEGFFLILSGALKKMVICDYVNLHLVTQVFSTPERFTGIENLAAMLGYSLVIYCDFSGYTDMARGIARWMGFSIQLNFNFPYRSQNIGEFWRRWHISLSNWLRDYLFLPLAFRLSRMLKQEYLFARSYLRTDLVIFNLAALVTFTVCGLWHGIGWNFLIWGLLHGAAIAIQKSWSHATRSFRRGRGKWFRETENIGGTLLTFLFVSVAWVFFRMRTPLESLSVFKQITSNFYARGLPVFVTAYYPVLLMMLAGYSLHFLPEEIYAKLRRSLVPLGWGWKTLIAVATVTLIVFFRSLGSSMPIYIQF